MGTKDKNHHGIKHIGNKASYSFDFIGNILDNLHQFDRNFRETCLAHKYLQVIGLDSVEHQWRSLLRQKCFKQAGNLLKNLEALQSIIEEHWKSICQASYWRSKVMVLHSSSNDQM